MRRQRGKTFLLLAVVLALALPLQSAFGASLEIKWVAVNGQEVAKEGQEVSVCSNYVTVSGEVYSSNGEPIVKVGSVICEVGNDSVRDNVYTFTTLYPLKAGKNSITVSAAAARSTDRFSFSINYQALPFKGATYIVPQLPAGGKIEAFSRALTLTYPKNAVLLDASGNLAGGATVTFTACGDPDGAPAGFTPAGQAFGISTSQAVYLSQQGQLTLLYDPSISSVSADQLSIWYSPDSRWGNGNDINTGGITDARRNAVTVPFQFRGQEGYYAVFLGQKTFKELANNLGGVGYSYPCVTALWAKGIAEPVTVGNDTETSYTNGYFGLVKNAAGNEKEATRLEFATMLVKGLGLPLSTKALSVFSDVYAGLRAADVYAVAYNGSQDQYDSNSTYYYPSVRAYVETATQKGIVVGYPDGTFRPGEKLTREQAAVILTRVANLKVSDDVKKAQEALGKIFKDGNKISPWAAPSVLAAYNAKLVSGEAGNDSLYFNPTGSLTRAQAITLVYRLLKKLKKL